MAGSSTCQIGELPVLVEFDDPDFGSNLSWVTDDLFERPYQGLLRTSTDDLVIYRNADLAALRLNPLATHQTLSAMTDGLRVPDSLTDSGLGRLLSRSSFSMRGGQHKCAKALASGLLTPKSMAPLAGDFAVIVRSLLDAALDRTEIDFVTDFARPAAALFWTKALGYTRDESERLVELASDIQLTFRVAPPLERMPRVNQSANEFIDMHGAILRRNARAGSYPWLSQLLTDWTAIPAEHRPQDPFEYLGATLIDGFHTLGAMFSSVVFAMIEGGFQPSQVSQDAASFASAAFQEAARIHPAITALARQASDDFEFQGVSIPKGTNLFTFWLFGNRDPEAFKDPLTYRLDRVNRVRQFHFGGGPYVCVGRNVIQVLCEWLLAELSEVGIQVERTGIAQWDPGSLLHELRQFPVALSVA